MLNVAHHAQVGNGGPVTAVFRNTTNGKAEVSITLDYSKASPPEFSYVADHCIVRPDISGFVIAFGKMSSDCSFLRTRIELSFPKGLFQNQLIESTRGLIEQMSQEGSNDIEPFEHRKFADPDKIQTFRSNNVMISLWGEEGLADFYYLAPSDVGKAAKNGAADISLNPVVRVTMSAGLIADFINQCKAFDKNPPVVSDGKG